MFAESKECGEEGIMAGCGKICYDYSNQRANGNNMQDICCGDYIEMYGITELCEDCDAKKEKE